MSQFIDIGALTDIPQRGARIVRTHGGDIAVFRTAADAVFAIDEYLGDKAGPFSNGIQHGNSVTDPIRNWIIDLTTGETVGTEDDVIQTYDVKVEDGRIMLAASAIRAKVAA